MIFGASPTRLLSRFSIYIILLLMALPLRAQNFTNLYSFANGNDGSSPLTGLIRWGNTLYGTAALGGSLGNGTIFSIKIDGTEFKTLYTFTGTNDGWIPRAALIRSGNTLYGTTGGTADPGRLGTIFSIKTDGTDFKTLHVFSGASDEGGPYGALVLSGNTLYGASSGVGTMSGNGTIFSIKTDGSNFNTLHAFNGGSDGYDPFGPLILSENTLYGTAFNGGSLGVGSIFSIKTDGTGFTTLYSFQGGNDGAAPEGGLIKSGNTLYGTASGGGSFTNGTIFSIKTDGTWFTTLYSFTGGNDGLSPVAGLILSNNILYGTASGGGSFTNGTIFSIGTDGSGFTTRYSLTNGYAVGENVQPILMLSGGTVYGTVTYGGTNGYGSVFSLPVFDTITVNALPTDGGSVRGGGHVAPGATLTVSAKAKSGYEFVDWTLGTNLVSTTQNFTFIENGSGTLVANFAQPLTLRVIASPAIGGTLKGGGTFPAGSSPTIQATAKGHYSFVNWTEGTNVVTSAAIYGFTLNKNTTLKANFTKILAP